MKTRWNYNSTELSHLNFLSFAHHNFLKKLFQHFVCILVAAKHFCRYAQCEKSARNCLFIVINGYQSEL